MTNPIQISRVGEVRPSQLMFTYGVGALVDLPKISVIVSGLDDWQLNPEYCHTITESRLLQAVQFHLSNVQKMVTPPLVTDDSGDTNPDSPTFYVGVWSPPSRAGRAVCAVRSRRRSVPTSSSWKPRSIDPTKPVIDIPTV